MQWWRMQSMETQAMKRETSQQGPTLEEAQEHVALVQAHGDLAHSIAIELANNPQAFHTAKVKRALKVYGDQRKKIDSFQGGRSRIVR